MAGLQGNLIADTFNGLLKTTDNGTIAGSKVITDGCGNNTSLTLGAAGQGSTFDSGLTVDSTFAACGFTYPSADGSAGQAIVTNGSGSLSIGQVCTAGLADLSPSPAACGRPSTIEVNAKGQVTDLCTVVPGFSSFETPGSNTFTFPQGTQYIKFYLTGSGARGRNVTGGGAGTVVGILSGSPGRQITVCTGARQTTDNTSGCNSYICFGSTELAMASGGIYCCTGGGGAPSERDFCSEGIVSDDTQVLSHYIIPGGGGGIDTDGGGDEESEGGSSFWGSPPSFGAGGSVHAKSTVNKPGVGYALFEWS